MKKQHDWAKIFGTILAYLLVGIGIILTVLIVIAVFLLLLNAINQLALNLNL